MNEQDEFDQDIIQNHDLPTPGQIQDQREHQQALQRFGGKMPLSPATDSPDHALSVRRPVLRVSGMSTSNNLLTRLTSDHSYGLSWRG